jgi:hypothetical protein
MERIMHRITFVILGMLGAAGCSGGSSPEVSAIDALVGTYLNKFLTCQSQPDPVPEVVRAQYGPLLRESLVRLTSLKGNGWSPEQMRACAAGFDRLTCEELVHGNAVPEACQPPGTLPTGSACASSDQCQTGRCVRSSGQQCGACGEVAQAGQGCGSTPCARDLVCLNGTCAQRGGAGAPCGAMNPPCKSGLTCRSGSCAVPVYGRAGDRCGMLGDSPCGIGLFCRSNACTPVTRAGQACDTPGMQCSTFHFCDPATRQCTAIRGARLGEACGATTLCTEGYCAGRPTGRCDARVPDGQPCMNPESCQVGSSCQNNVCTAPPMCPAM